MEQTLKRYDFGPFHNVSSPTFGNIFAFFLIFKRGQNEEVQRKNCAEITGRENGKKNSNQLEYSGTKIIINNQKNNKNTTIECLF